MTLSVSKLRLDRGELFFYKSIFKQGVEDHLTELINEPSTSNMSVTPFQNGKYRGDFYGLLIDLKVPMDLHWVILRMNGYHNPTAFTSDLLWIIVPDRGYLSVLAKRLNVM